MKEILGLFTDPDNISEWMNSPFLLNGHTGATDGCTMIIVKGSLKGASHISGDKENNVWNVLPVHCENYKISLKELKEAVAKAPLIDETEYQGDDVECKACDGDGEVEYTFCYRGREYECDYDCPICNGSGLESAAVKVATGNKIPGPECLIQFGSCRLKAEYVARLVKVVEYEKLETLSIVSEIYHSNSPVLFKVGETRVLIMPRLHDDEDVVIHKFEIA